MLKNAILLVRHDTLSSMNTNVLASLGWERRVTELAAEIANQVGRSSG
jgi:hypothetical protein